VMKGFLIFQVGLVLIISYLDHHSNLETR
jgi:hypothetical protein